MIKCGRGKTNPQKMQRKTATNILWCGECLCRLHCKYLYSWWRITQTIGIPTKIQKISQWNRCSTYLRNWYPNNQMRSMEWKQSTGKTLHGSVCLWQETNKSSVSAQRSASFQILCCVLDEREPSIKYCMGRQIDVVQKFIRIHDFGQNWWWANGNSSGISSRIHHIAALPQSPRVLVKKWAYNQKISLDGSFSCRCSTTSHGDLKTTKKNASQMLFSFLSLQRESEQDNGHSSGLVQRKMVFCQCRQSKRRMGQNCRENDVDICKKHTPSLLSHEPLSRGRLKSKGGEKLSIHYCADPGRIETVFRTIISVNQLSTYGAVSNLCDECKTCHVRTGRPVVAGQSDPLFVPSVMKRHTHLWPMILRKKKIHCKNTKNELKSYHNKTNWANFVWMQDFRSGIPLNEDSHKENGTESLSWWW